MGKPIQYALSVDVPATARCIAWYAEAVDKVYDEIAPTGRERAGADHARAMGVIGAIVPWNYPMIMAAWKLGPALATGNSVVLKPSEKSPLTALRLAELAVEAGMPPGVFNVVPGYGHEAGEALALHMDVDAIGFTGSTRTGRMLEYAAAATSSGSTTSWAASRPSSSSRTSPTSSAPPGPWPAAMFFNQGESCNAPVAGAGARERADRFVEIACRRGDGQYQPADPLDAGHDDGRAGRRNPDAPCSATSTPAAAGRPGGAGGRRARSRDRWLLRRADRVRRRDNGDEDRARGDLRPGVSA
jgi:acyl-CoA reductase-like NAD-dependent aldehyde dehydrogenase